MADRRKLGPVRSRRQLIHEIREARDAAGLTQRDLASALDWSISKVYRMENGEVAIATSDLLALLSLYGVTDGTRRERYIELARTSRERTEVSRLAAMLSPQFAQFLEAEGEASMIRWFETDAIPGPFQIPEYTASMVKAYSKAAPSDETIRTHTAVRQLRAKSLFSTDGPRMRLILCELALRRAVGQPMPDGVDFMVAQLEHLARMNTVGLGARGEPVPDDLNPNISIQIVPLAMGPVPSMPTPFQHLDFPDDYPQMMYVEAWPHDVLWSDMAEDVRPFATDFDELADRLAGPAEANDQLSYVIGLMREGRNGIPWI